MKSTEKAIRDFCGHHADWWPSTTQVQEMLTLAQTEQEPVAWMFQHEETARIMFVEAQQLESGFEKGNPRLKKIGPLYTTPPAAQRTWVGLTEDERINLSYKSNGNECVAVELTETKLRSKNT
jgi:hypothetical protein